MTLRIGKPSDFFSPRDLRLKSIQRATAHYQYISGELKKELKPKLLPGTLFFLKGFGNDVDLLAVFRELFFNSRELLDLLLINISKLTGITPRKFLPFLKKITKGEFDTLNLKIVGFLKENITYIFHMRKIRNEIKSNPANIDFRFNTDHFEAHIVVPIDNDEVELIPHLDIQNKAEALKNKSYKCTYDLDKLFHEIRVFWDTTFSILDDDLQIKALK